MSPQDEQQFITNKQLLDEIREKQKIHDERLEEHELKIERNRLEIEQIKKILSNSNIFKWNFVSILIASFLTYLIQLLT